MALPLEHAFGGILLLRHDGRQDGAPAATYGQPLAARCDTVARLAIRNGAARAPRRLAAPLVHLAERRAYRAGQQRGQLRGGDDVHGEVNPFPAAQRAGAREHGAQGPGGWQRGDVEAQRGAPGAPDAAEGHHVGGAYTAEPGHRRGEAQQRARGAVRLTPRRRRPLPATLPLRVLPAPPSHLLEHLELLLLLVPRAPLGSGGPSDPWELHRLSAAAVHGRQRNAKAQHHQHGQCQHSHDDGRHGLVARGRQPIPNPIRTAVGPVCLGQCRSR
mmetsp:Transcript_60068/g.159799  ORF Transcript_60068/g.159799 Transcript_60068/m.159799 type:complete len:273 (+) Transcript_60068:663-1481(+)